MKFTLYLILSFFSIVMMAQPTTEYAVQTWAEIDVTAPTITINWVPVNGATSYKIYRKLKEYSVWGNVLVTLDAETTSYVDTDIEVEVSYEYKIEKIGNVSGFGYINSGINVAPNHFKGRMLLLVDDTFSSSLSDEISRLKTDLIGNGWTVVQKNINRNGTVAEVRIIIDTEYDKNKIDAIYCLGHIPVPYSSNYAPDGHQNNHEGAWPADGYYGDINGNWTDVTANNTSASQERNHNVPGDGKFDQLYFPSKVEMQVGRVDFSNMPAFSESEEELLRRYLEKSHEFKIGNITANMQAVIDDNFGGFSGEAFAGSAWKSFGPLLHPENVSNGDYRSSMDTTSYMWSYGCGGGSFSSCNGVGTTSDFAGDSLQGIFSCMFGSYFGDWDSENNLLRATLAQGTNLTNCWNGRPHWYFHHMGMGENIGYSTRLSMNNKGIFYNSPLAFLGNMVSMGLMGDPSLTMFIVKPISDLSADATENDIELSWTDTSTDNIGYYIYRSSDYDGAYVLLNEEPVVDKTYIDECIESSGTYFYMVRVTKLETTPSGQFYNLSQGMIIEIEKEVAPIIASFSEVTIDDLVTLTNLSTNANSWNWDFGDGTTSSDFEPTHNYLVAQVYDITLVALNECFSDTFSLQVHPMFVGVEDLESTVYSIYPNPGKERFTLTSEIPMMNTSIGIFDLNGKKVKSFLIDNGAMSTHFLLDNFTKGVYFVHVGNDVSTRVLRIVVQ